nr:E3 ubiquitin-protein ligase HERC2-like isoform X2 [Salvelinus alpinus]
MPTPYFTLDAQLRFHDKWLKIDLQRVFSPEGLSEMWNEMVKDEEITFNGEESAHPDCTDCFGTQKKDESNDKEKKDEEEVSTSVHHSIIETWDWGRQPGGWDLFILDRAE